MACRIHNAGTNCAFLPSTNIERIGLPATLVYIAPAVGAGVHCAEGDQLTGMRTKVQSMTAFSILGRASRFCKPGVSRSSNHTGQSCPTISSSGWEDQAPCAGYCSARRAWFSVQTAGAKLCRTPGLLRSTSSFQS